MTVLEAAKRRDPDGNAAKIAEVLEQKNTVWKDAPVRPANDTNSHVTTIRLEEGTPTIRRINRGAEMIGSKTKQVRDEIMLLENFLALDEQIVEREGENAKEFRAGELKGSMGGYTKGFHNNLWYGGGADIGEVVGLANRFNSLSMDNVWNAGGSGNDLSSVWAIEWAQGENAHLFYPKSANGCGIEEKDLGLIKWQDDDGKPYMAYVNQIKLQFGLAIRDSMAVQRLANIESDTTLSANNLKDQAVIDMLIEMLTMLPEGGEGAVIYVNRKLKAQIDQMAFAKYGGFRFEEIGGKRVTFFMECPIRLQDSLLPTESALVA